MHAYRRCLVALLAAYLSDIFLKVGIEIQKDNR